MCANVVWSVAVGHSGTFMNKDLKSGSGSVIISFPTSILLVDMTIVLGSITITI